MWCLRGLVEKRWRKSPISLAHTASKGKFIIICRHVKWDTLYGLKKRPRFFFLHKVFFVQLFFVKIMHYVEKFSCFQVFFSVCSSQQKSICRTILIRKLITLTPCSNYQSPPSLSFDKSVKLRQSCTHTRENQHGSSCHRFRFTTTVCLKNEGWNSFFSPWELMPFLSFGYSAHPAMYS